MAPELFPEGAKSSKEADMYAFGMVVYEVVTGARPFGCHRIGELFLLTTRGVRPNRPEDPAAIGFGEGTWEFIERCWDRNWGRRPTAREALEHFKHVAKTSTIVEPGSLISAHGTANETSSGTVGSTRSFCECRGPSTASPLTTLQARLFVQSSSTSPNRLQQTAFATRVLVSNQRVPVPFLPANGEPNLLFRMPRESSRPALHLIASPQDGT
jgi:serine/threonine protein kinase